MAKKLSDEHSIRCSTSKSTDQPGVKDQAPAECSGEQLESDEVAKKSGSVLPEIRVGLRLFHLGDRASSQSQPASGPFQS